MLQGVSQLQDLLILNLQDEGCACVPNRTAFILLTILRQMVCRKETTPVMELSPDAE